MATDQEADFLIWLNEILGPTQRAFQGPNATDLAHGLANQQRARWQQLLKIFEAKGSRPNNVIFGRIQLLANIIAQAPLPTIQKGKEDEALVDSQLPLIQVDPPQSRIDVGYKYTLVAAALLAKRCQPYLMCHFNHELAPFIESAAAADANRIVFVNKEAFSSVQEAAEKQLSAAIAESKKTISASKQATDNLEAFKVAIQVQFDDSTTSLNQLMSEFEKFSSDAKSSDESRRKEWDTERESALKALRDEVKEFVKIESSITLWRTKANWHTAAYVTLGVIFGLALIGIAGLFLTGHVTGFINEIAKIPADHQFLGIAILAIPTLAIAWLLRFIARLAIQNLALAHDARQRHAQITTYLKLLGDPQKPISENERILALAALFRPLPGQGPEDVNPPTIADLLKEAAEKSTKGLR